MRSRPLKTERVAKNWQSVLCHEPAELQPQVQAALQAFWASKGLRAATRRRMRVAASEFLAWVALRGTALSAVGPAMIQEYLNQPHGDRGGKRVQLVAIRQLFAALVENHVCAATPADLVREYRSRQETEALQRLKDAFGAMVPGWKEGEASFQAALVIMTAITFRISIATELSRITGIDAATVQQFTRRLAESELRLRFGQVVRR